MNDSQIILGPITACRNDPAHEHWVYECPLVADAISAFADLKKAEGVLEALKEGAPGLEEARQEVARRRVAAKSFASSGRAWASPRTPAPRPRVEPDGVPVWE